MTKDEQHTEETDSVEAPSNSFNAIPWVAGALLILGVAVIAGLYWTRTVTVSKVHFTGNHFVQLNELEKQVDIPAGVQPDSLNFMEIISRVEHLPYVQHADINVEPGGNLVIHVEERRPIALLTDGGQKIYVDAEGIKLPIILGKAVDVPLLYGFSAKPMDDTLNSDAFQAVRDFLVDVHNRPVSDATISEVAWNSDEGVIALTNENGVKLVFGKENFKIRLRNWEVFYAKIIRQKGINSMHSIDLRFKGQIVTRES